MSRIWEILEFWRLVNPKVTLLFADANGRLGSEQSFSVGKMGQETQNSNGGHFHSLLNQLSLVAPQTMLANGGGWTWTSPHGSHARIDYVAIPKHCFGEDPLAWRAQTHPRQPVVRYGLYSIFCGRYRTHWERCISASPTAHEGHGSPAC